MEVNTFDVQDALSCQGCCGDDMKHLEAWREQEKSQPVDKTWLEVALSEETPISTYPREICFLLYSLSTKALKAPKTKLRQKERGLGVKLDDISVCFLCRNT